MTSKNTQIQSQKTIGQQSDDSISSDSEKLYENIAAINEDSALEDLDDNESKEGEGNIAEDSKAQITPHNYQSKLNNSLAVIREKQIESSTSVKDIRECQLEYEKQNLSNNSQEIINDYQQSYQSNPFSNNIVSNNKVKELGDDDRLGISANTDNHKQEGMGADTKRPTPHFTGKGLDKVNLLKSQNSMNVDNNDKDSNFCPPSWSQVFMAFIGGSFVFYDAYWNNSKICASISNTILGCLESITPMKYLQDTQENI